MTTEIIVEIILALAIVLFICLNRIGISRSKSH